MAAVGIVVFVGVLIWFGLAVTSSQREQTDAEIERRLSALNALPGSDDLEDDDDDDDWDEANELDEDETPAERIKAVRREVSEVQREYASYSNATWITVAIILAGGLALVAMTAR